jgi:hypothetical protein
MTIELEYRVKEVTRYIVTRFTQNEGQTERTVETRGEYDNDLVAHEVAYALCKNEHHALGWPFGDERIKYPLPNIDSAKISNSPATG